MTDLIPTIEIVSDRPVVSSLKVAEQFNKNHAHVLRDIRKIITEVSEEFGQSNFGSADYVDEQGKNRVMFWLTKDGFTILAMGYTGKEIMRLKEAYIRRFNDMEATLHGQALPSPETDPTAHLTPSQCRHLHDIMDAKCSVIPKDMERKARAEGWSRLGRKFRVAKYDQITQGQFDEALNYLIGMELRARALPEPTKALPASTDPTLKALATGYYNAVVDLQTEIPKRMAEVEAQGRKLADEIKIRALTLLGTDNSPSTVLAQHKFIDAMNAGHRIANQTMRTSLESMRDHAMLLEGLAVLSR